MALLSLEEAAAYLGCRKRSLQAKHFRIKIGLPAVYIGNRLKFDERDLEKLIDASREQLPVMPKNGWVQQ